MAIELTTEQKHSLRRELDRASGEVMMPFAARRLMVRTQVEAVEKWLSENELSDPAAFEPTRWWRVYDTAGKLRLETTDEDEARSRAQPGERIERLWNRTAFEWRETGDAVDPT